MTASRSPVHLEGLPVLAVDDNETKRLTLKEILTGWRMRPVVVESGKLALDAMEQAYKTGRPFPLVLLDCHMQTMGGFTLAELIRRSPHLSRATIMMLTSRGRGGDIARCPELAIAAYLIRPIKQSELMDSILRTPDLTETVVEQPYQEIGTLSATGTKGLRILLAEDNEINRRPALRLLKKQGHTVMIVGNGQDALDALARECFDIALINVQTPKMGGFEATEAIRAREPEGGPRLPTIAMTANAMQDDDEGCLEVAMDGYVSKPLQAEKLYAEIERVIAVSVETKRWADCLDSVGIEREAGGNEESVFNFAGALERLSGDEELLREIAALFLSDYPRRISNIKDAIKRGDCEAVGFAAHALKGAVGNFDAQASFEAAQKLEMMAQSGELKGLDVALVNLEKEIERFSDALRLYHEEHMSCES